MIWQCTPSQKNPIKKIPGALSPAWEVFSEFEAPDYSEEGTKEFFNRLQDNVYLSGIEYYSAYEGKTLVGEIGIRPKEKHICFFFVKGEYQRRGIGTNLFKNQPQIIKGM